MHRSRLRIENATAHKCTALQICKNIVGILTFNVYENYLFVMFQLFITVILYAIYCR